MDNLIGLLILGMLACVLYLCSYDYRLKATVLKTTGFKAKNKVKDNKTVGIKAKNTNQTPIHITSNTVYSSTAVPKIYDCPHDERDYYAKSHTQTYSPFVQCSECDMRMAKAQAYAKAHKPSLIGKAVVGTAIAVKYGVLAGAGPVGWVMILLGF